MTDHDMSYDETHPQDDRPARVKVAVERMGCDVLPIHLSQINHPF